MFIGLTVGARWESVLGCADHSDENDAGYASARCVNTRGIALRDCVWWQRRVDHSDHSNPTHSAVLSDRSPRGYRHGRKPGADRHRVLHRVAVRSVSARVERYTVRLSSEFYIPTRRWPCDSRVGTGDSRNEGWRSATIDHSAESGLRIADGRQHPAELDARVRRDAAERWVIANSRNCGCRRSASRSEWPFSRFPPRRLP